MCLCLQPILSNAAKNINIGVHSCFLVGADYNNVKIRVKNELTPLAFRLLTELGFNKICMSWKCYVAPSCLNS